MDDLLGRVAVVTGAAGGIGRALAERFAAEGMKVVLADVDRAAVEAAARQVAGASDAETLAVVTDVSRADEVEALAERACERFGTVHVVCNNAGVLGQAGTTWETSASEWEWVLGVNLWGVVHGVRTFVPILVEQDEGHVVNTASAAGWLTVPGTGPYAASKHAVLAVSEALRLELEGRKSRVGVSVLCPQFVKTSILSSDRLWPEHLGERPAPAQGRTARVREALAKGITEGVPASVVADVVVTGIKENRFVVTEDPAAIAANADRRAAVARGAPPRFGR